LGGDDRYKTRAYLPASAISATATATAAESPEYVVTMESKSTHHVIFPPLMFYFFLFMSIIFKTIQFS
jgi:hypothetical protein